jgi:putative flippase GtrA
MQEFRSSERLSTQENKRQIVRFLVVGLVSVAVDLACYMFLGTILFFATSVAKGISYLAGMAVGFVGNKYWTFGSTRRSASEPVTYVVLYIVTLAVNIGVNSAVLGMTGGWTVPAFLLATGVTTVLNFLGMRLVTFRDGIQDRLRAQSGGPSQPHAVPAPHLAAELRSAPKFARS